MLVHSCRSNRSRRRGGSMVHTCQQHTAVFQMDRDKSPGPNGFPAEFCQQNCELVKWDLKSLLDDFHSGQIDISRLSYGLVTLIPKCRDATRIRKFKPICLLNVSFKIVTEVLMNRLNCVAGAMISPFRTTSVKGRHIMGGLLILHETFNTIHTRKQDALLSKVDYEKAYNKTYLRLVFVSLQNHLET